MGAVTMARYSLRSPGPRAGRRPLAWLTLAALLPWVLALAGCGKGGEGQADPDQPAPDPAGSGMAEAPPADGPQGAAPDAGGGEEPPPDPSMGGAPAPAGAPGAPAAGAPPGAAPAAQPASPADAKPPFKSKPMPFGAIDKPISPPPPPPPQPMTVQVLPVRATLSQPPPGPRRDTREGDVLPDARTAGFVWGATVKAILQVGSKTEVVRPGDTFTTEGANPREFTVVAIGADGVRLRDRADGRTYLAPYRR